MDDGDSNEEKSDGPDGGHSDSEDEKSKPPPMLSATLRSSRRYLAPILQHSSRQVEVEQPQFSVSQKLRGYIS